MVDRVGTDNIPKGQGEAAKACNLTARQPRQHTIVLRAVPSRIPALANHFRAMFKETPLLSAITILETMALLGVVSLVINIPSVILLRRFGARG